MLRQRLAGRWFCLLFLVLSSAAQAADRPRLVSLAPSLTELVFALGHGDALVGRSSACDYPAQAASIPVVGDFGRPNLERLHELKPDFVLITDLEKPGLAQHMATLGATCLVLPCESWTNVLEAARRIGVACGDEKGAAAWIQAAQARRRALQERVDRFYGERPRPRVYFEVWGDPLTTVGRDSFLDDLISLAGGINIGARLTARYAYVGSEWVVQQRPDVIVMAYMNGDTEAAAASLRRRPGWEELPAVQNGKVCAEIPADILLRPGPRWLDGAERLAEFLARRDGAL